MNKEKNNNKEKTESKNQVEKRNNEPIRNDEIDLLQLALKLWSYRKYIIIATASIIVIGTIYSLVAKKVFEASTTLYQVTREDQASSRISALASQFGMGASMGSSPDYNLKDLAYSRKICEKVIFNQWNTENFDNPVNLIEYWEIEGETEGMIFNSAYEKLKNAITFSEDEESGLKTLSVHSAEPELAAKMANFFVDIIQEYIKNEQKTSTKENLKYLNERVDSVKQELTAAEEELKEFRENNRLVGESPELMLEQGRLQRQVTIKQEVYLTLQKEKEMALIDLVKETPVINVLDEAVKPEQRIKPKRKLIAVISAFVGFFLSIFGVIAWEIYLYLKNYFKENADTVQL